MSRRRCVVATLLVVLLAACQPDPVSPGGGSETTHPSDHAAPSETESTGDRYDY